MRWKTAGWVIVLGALTTAAAVAHLATGRVGLTPDEVVAALTGVPAVPFHEQIVVGLRLPRTLVAIAAGAMLGLAGALLQSLTRNELAEPALLGVTGGSVLAVVAVLGSTGGSGVGATARPFVALAGAVLGLAVVLALTGREGRDPRRLVLTGAIVSSVLTAITSVLLVLDGSLFGSVLRWVVGSLSGRVWADWAVLWPWAVVSVAAGLLCSRPVTSMWVGRDIATAVGARTGWTSVAVVATSSLLTAGAVAAVGAVAFVGLLAPHLARRLVGAHPARVLPVATAAGALVLVGADALAEAITVTVPIGGIGDRAALPTGAVTALLGGPLLLVLLRRVTST